MNTLAAGSTDITVADTNRGDEIGDMARAFQVFLNQRSRCAGCGPDHGEHPPGCHARPAGEASAVSQVSDGSNIQLNALKQSSGALEQSAQAIAEVAAAPSRRARRARSAASLVEKEIVQMTSMVELVGAISREQLADQLDRRSDLAHRQPDQHAVAQRLDRGGTRRRARSAASPWWPRRSASWPVARAASPRTSPSRWRQAT